MGQIDFAKLNGDGTKYLGVHMWNSVTGKGGFETQGLCVSVGFRKADRGSSSNSMLFFLHSRKPRAQQPGTAKVTSHSPAFLAHFYLCPHLSVFVGFLETESEEGIHVRRLSKGVFFRTMPAR